MIPGELEEFHSAVITMCGSCWTAMNATIYDSPAVKIVKRMRLIGDVRRTPSQQPRLINVVSTATNARIVIHTL